MATTEIAAPRAPGRFRPSPLFLALVGGCVFWASYLWVAKGTNRFAIFMFVACGWVVSLCLHEFAHAVVAYHGGDTSVADKGYLTLDPRRYTHPVLSIALPLLFFVIGGIGLPGGAVYIDRTKLKTRGTASAVAAAGPLANVVLAIGLFSPFRLAGASMARHPQFAFAFAALGVLQVVAAILNLLPVPPFDGFSVVEPLFVDPRHRTRRVRPITLPLVLVLLLGGGGTVLWRASYRVGYAFHVPRGEASGGIRLARFWTPNTVPITSGPAGSTARSADAPEHDLPHPRSGGDPSLAMPRGLRAGVVDTGGGPHVVLTWALPSNEPFTLVYRADGGGSFASSTPIYSARADGGRKITFDDVVRHGRDYAYYIVAAPTGDPNAAFSRPVGFSTNVP